MRTHGLKLAGVLIIILFSSSLLAEDNSDDLRQIIGAVNEKMNRAFIEGDDATTLSYHADDTIVMSDFKPIIRGKKALKRQMELDRKRGGKVHSVSSTIADIWSCGDMVYERGTFGLSVTMPGMSQPYAFYGSYFTIWQQQSDESYKIKLNIWNLDFNPWEK
jgi:ketosteroid isomerase-like protein